MDLDALIPLQPQLKLTISISSHPASGQASFRARSIALFTLNTGDPISARWGRTRVIFPGGDTSPGCRRTFHGCHSLDLSFQIPSYHNQITNATP
jgi:hypothetical protein